MEFTKELLQILIANKIIPANANTKQVEYFLEVCKRKGLDPFLKQMHMIERKENVNGNWIPSYTIQASLDGMRAIAQRNCKIISYKRWTKIAEGYDGKKQIYGCCEVATADRGTYSDEVPFNEYVQLKKDGSITHFWKQFPETMIKKVAEESVLRMLAPEDLSGVYGDDEMLQSDNESLSGYKQNLIEAPKEIKAEIVEESQENLTDKYEELFKGKTPVEIKEVYNHLPVKEKGKDSVAYKVANFFADQSKEKIPTDDVLILISKITAKSTEGQFSIIEGLIESTEQIDKRKIYGESFKAQLIKVGSKYEPNILPF